MVAVGQEVPRRFLDRLAEHTLCSKVIFDCSFFLTDCNLVLQVQVQCFLELMALEILVVRNYLEDRDIAIFAFHYNVLPAHERRKWCCGGNPRQESVWLWESVIFSSGAQFLHIRSQMILKVLPFF